MRDRPVAETSTWQHTKFTTDRYPFPRAGFESAIPACGRLQTHTLDRAATRIGLFLYSAFGKSLCTYKSCWKCCPRASIQAWARLILFANTFRRSAFGKSLCTYKRCWKWCPRASIQAWARLILFANTFRRSAFEMFLMNAVIAVFNSLSVRGRSRYDVGTGAYVHRDFPNARYILAVFISGQVGVQRCANRP
jgi:hypothetical protein